MAETEKKHEAGGTGPKVEEFIKTVQTIGKVGPFKDEIRLEVRVPMAVSDRLELITEKIMFVADAITEPIGQTGLAGASVVLEDIARELDDITDGHVLAYLPVIEEGPDKARKA